MDKRAARRKFTNEVPKVTYQMYLKKRRREEEIAESSSTKTKSSNSHKRSNATEQVGHTNRISLPIEKDDNNDDENLSPNLLAVRLLLLIITLSYVLILYSSHCSFSYL